MARIITFAGVEISDQVARDLNNYRHVAQMESVGLRLWNEILTLRDRDALEGRFSAAFCKYGRTIGMYRQLNPHVSIERAILEVLHELGMLHTPRYRRLVLAIGEQPETPPALGSRPLWDANCGLLTWGGTTIRRIRQPRRAKNIVAVLDAFQRLNWSNHIPLSEILSLPSYKIHQTLFDLNEGLDAIVFSMNGSGDYVRWMRR